jgi:hypothetical protein
VNALSPRDLARLHEAGIGADEAERQLALLRHPPPGPELVRPCTAGDGIERIDPRRFAALEALHEMAAAAGRVSAFVPASGAATRMFREAMVCRAGIRPLTRAALEAAAAGGSAEARGTLALIQQLTDFAFASELDEFLARGGASLAGLRDAGLLEELLGALLDPSGLGYAERPKGLLAFHRDAGGVRTAFEEHLAEAGALAADAAGDVRLHFTVSPQHLAGFEARLAAVRGDLERDGRRFSVGFSVQHSSTDTLAVDLEGGPFRDPSGVLVLRPAGHGALIENLADSGGDLVTLKNIDNVANAAHRAPTLEWMRRLTGLLLETQSMVTTHLERLEGEADVSTITSALAFAQRELGGLPKGGPEGRTLEELRAWARAALRRPLRVCGMVPNTGEPGGGPFWVKQPDGGVTRQIVESAEVRDDPAQRDVFARSTHFNPVFMVCALREPSGERVDIARFVDPDAAILTRKSAYGRELRALERPGLWNGAMAHWGTRFVEVPLAVFNPVKTVLDLLRPEHLAD